MDELISHIWHYTHTISDKYICLHGDVALAVPFLERIGFHSEHSHNIWSLLPQNQAWRFPFTSELY